MKHISQESFSSPRLKREAKTIEVMIRMYCKTHHQGDGLCHECHDLLLYSRKRLYHCRFQSSKPVCGNCTIHCYKPEMREAICKVMRYSGPRMAYRHPVMAIRHLLDKLKKMPEVPEVNSRCGKTQPQNSRLNTFTDQEGGK